MARKRKPETRRPCVADNDNSADEAVNAAVISELSLELRTEQELADLLRVSIRMTRQLRYSGKISYYLLGNRVRYSNSQILEFLENRECHVKICEQDSQKQKSALTGIFSTQKKIKPNGAAQARRTVAALKASLRSSSCKKGRTA